MTLSPLNSTPPELIFAVGSDRWLSLVTLTEKLTGTAVTTATVSAVIKDEDGNPVSGISNPLTLTHASGGTYRAIVPDDADLWHGQRITVEITADDGADRKAYWKRVGTIHYI